eukprot:TRINITY_DN8916_c0_g1_i4.p2 TRINITY_DN8916_c0_g1~~TRINITY_DN8916_c0_g1_i4.p2  ORF type:complete len:104 (+),score=1.03 TRINITY_DN8916_c0_g1_i4:60-371(+)
MASDCQLGAGASVTGNGAKNKSAIGTEGVHTPVCRTIHNSNAFGCRLSVASNAAVETLYSGCHGGSFLRFDPSQMAMQAEYRHTYLEHALETTNGSSSVMSSA